MRLRPSPTRRSRRTSTVPRVTSAARLDAGMRTVGRVRHKAYLRLAIADVSAGAESLGEIDLAHLCWGLENLAAGTPVNVIKVDPDTAHHALVALERMLAVR
jgi:quinolinate synthase